MKLKDDLPSENARWFPWLDPYRDNGDFPRNHKAVWIKRAGGDVIGKIAPEYLNPAFNIADIWWSPAE